MSTRSSSTESCSELQKKTGGSSTKGNVALEKSCLLHNPLCRGEEGTEGTQEMQLKVAWAVWKAASSSSLRPGVELGTAAAAQYNSSISQVVIALPQHPPCPRTPGAHSRAAWCTNHGTWPGLALCRGSQEGLALRELNNNRTLHQAQLPTTCWGARSPRRHRTGCAVSGWDGASFPHSSPRSAVLCTHS